MSARCGEAAAVHQRVDVLGRHVFGEPAGLPPAMRKATTPKGKTDMGTVQAAPTPSSPPGEVAVLRTGFNRMSARRRRLPGDIRETSPLSKNVTEAGGTFADSHRGVPFANRVHTLVWGLPVLLLWIVVWVFLTASCMTLLYALDHRATADERGEGCGDAAKERGPASRYPG